MDKYLENIGLDGSITTTSGIIEVNNDITKVHQWLMLVH